MPTEVVEERQQETSGTMGHADGESSHVSGMESRREAGALALETGGQACFACDPPTGPVQFGLCPFDWRLQQQAVQQDSSSFRMVMKIMDATPGDLPHNLRMELMEMMQSMPSEIQSEICPGCVLLSMECQLSSRKDVAAAKSAFLRSLQEVMEGKRRGLAMWKGHDIDIQLPGAAVQVRGGEITAAVEEPCAPTIQAVQPAAGWASTVSLLVWEAGHEDFAVLCRINGSCFELDVCDVEEQADGSLRVDARLPPMEVGAARLELMQQRGGFTLLSNAETVLVSHRQEMVDEICGSPMGPGAASAGFFSAAAKDIGSVMEPTVGESPPQDCFARAVAVSARFGWDRTLNHLLETAEACGVLPSVLEEADRTCGGLLKTAVYSRSLSVLITVSRTGAPLQRLRG